MTGKTLSDRLNARGGERSDLMIEGEGAEDFGSFGWLRGIRDRAVMLELRKANGNIMAIGYAWLERAEFNPSEGITLHGVGAKIRIKGRNLNAEVRPTIRLYEGITRHRVPWIQEAGESEKWAANVGATEVERIEW